MNVYDDLILKYQMKILSQQLRKIKSSFIIQIN
jgi:hypothetical protein